MKIFSVGLAYNADDKESILQIRETEKTQHAEAAKALWNTSEHDITLLIYEHNVRNFEEEDFPDLNSISVDLSATNNFGSRTYED